MESIWEWVKGRRPKFWGRTYRGGVLIFGLIGFLLSWFGATLAGGFMGFMVGWLPSLIVGAIVGFLWPLLAVGGAIAGGVAAYPLVMQDAWWRSDPLADSAEGRFAVFKAQVCSNLPNPFDQFDGKLHLVPPEQLSQTEKQEVRDYLRAIARDRAALNRVREACRAQSG